MCLAHKCDYPGCSQVLVLDGNLKNHRDVCYAKDAGFIEFDGLDGSVKTGCQSTPDYKSRFCKDHKNQAVELREQSDSIDGNTTLPRNFKQGYPIPELVPTKKTTRKETYYQV